MSTRRTSGVGKLRKDAQGRNLCRWCSKPVSPPRRTFCGDPCVHQWRIRRDIPYVRSLLLKRDNGICAKCGVDAIALYHELKLLERHDKSAWEARVKRDKIPTNRMTLWDADHIVPVAEGGGECGLEGYQTLCFACHREKTKAQQKAAALRRREEKGTSD